jgi:hypothetical protein
LFAQTDQPAEADILQCCLPEAIDLVRGGFWSADPPAAAGKIVGDKAEHLRNARGSKDVIE